MASEPVQAVLDRQPPHPPGIHHIRGGWRIRSPRGPIQGSIRQTQTLIDHCFFGLSSSQLRNRIDLIQTQLTSRKPGAKQRKILQSPGHPNQLHSSRMPQPKPGRHPLRKIASPIHQEQLTPIRLDQPFASRGQSCRRKTQKMTDSRLDLIIRIHPLHATQRTNRLGQIRVRNQPSEEKSQKIPGRLTPWRTTVPVLSDPDWPGRTRHAGIPGPDRSRPQPGWSLPCDSRP